MNSGLFSGIAAVLALLLLGGLIYLIMYTSYMKSNSTTINKAYNSNVAFGVSIALAVIAGLIILTGVGGYVASTGLFSN